LQAVRRDLAAFSSLMAVERVGRFEAAISDILLGVRKCLALGREQNLPS
jgi:hypothetical protein